jgi:hypothetical protein
LGNAARATRQVSSGIEGESCGCSDIGAPWLDVNPPGWRAIRRFGCLKLNDRTRTIGKNRDLVRHESFLRYRVRPRINLAYAPARNRPASHKSRPRPGRDALAPNSPPVSLLGLGHDGERERDAAGVGSTFVARLCRGCPVPYCGHEHVQDRGRSGGDIWAAFQGRHPGRQVRSDFGGEVHYPGRRAKRHRPPPL